MDRERRKAPRIPLDAPCLLTLFLASGEKYPAMVVDVSSGGVQFALSPGLSTDAFAVGEAVVMAEVSAPLGGILENARGTVAWVGKRCCGVRLDAELPAYLLSSVELVRL